LKYIYTEEPTEKLSSCTFSRSIQKHNNTKPFRNVISAARHGRIIIYIYIIYPPPPFSTKHTQTYTHTHPRQRRKQVYKTYKDRRRRGEKKTGRRTRAIRCRATSSRYDCAPPLGRNTRGKNPTTIGWEKGYFLLVDAPQRTVWREFRNISTFSRSR